MRRFSHRRRYTAEEIDLAAAMWADGAGRDEMARVLRRTPGSVSGMLHHWYVRGGDGRFAPREPVEVRTDRKVRAAFEEMRGRGTLAGLARAAGVYHNTATASLARLGLVLRPTKVTERPPRLEARIVALAWQGLFDEEIAEQVGTCTPKTVREIISRMRKRGVRAPYVDERASIRGARP